MNDRLSGPLSLFWKGFLVSVICNALSLIDGVIGTLATVASLAALIVQIYALVKMRAFHERFEKAFQYMVIELILLAVSLVCSVLMLAGIRSVGAGVGASLLILLIVLAAAILGLLQQFQFYWALDALNDQNRFGYETGRIRWCFYVPLIGAAVGVLLQLLTGLPTTVISILFSIPVLWLLWQYIGTLREWEQKPHEDEPPAIY